MCFLYHMLEVRNRSNGTRMKIHFSVRLCPYALPTYTWKTTVRWLICFLCEVYGDCAVPMACGPDAVVPGPPARRLSEGWDSWDVTQVEWARALGLVIRAEPGPSRSEVEWGPRDQSLSQSRVWPKLCHGACREQSISSGSKVNI